MTVTIPDESVREAGLTEREVLTELACRSFDIGRLSLWPAARLAGLARLEMEEEVAKRNSPIYRPTLADFEQDMKNLAALGRAKPAGG